MISTDEQTSSYDYELPSSFIATHPVYPRDEAKLLVYDRATDTLSHKQFKDILKFIPKNVEIFLNDTKVIKARLFGKKSSGGKIELLFNKALKDNKYLVFIKGRVKLGTQIEFEDELFAVVVELLDDGLRVVEFKKDGKDIAFFELMEIFEQIGHIPLPPYIQREDNKCDEIDYQPLFAQNFGAVAAPTASLHFTQELFNELQTNYKLHYITLHVGAGTFKPIEVENILEHTMHSESFHIPQNSADVLNSDKKVMAIGTTVTRTIEYFKRTGELSGECNLFLHPNNTPIRVDMLLTNFHLPKSTLIMLVASFIGREKTLEIYEEAIKHNYRFFSYGDAMLIL
jgi:S-adenosylmethionine:tRNA ribosyltransferase-isomerase